MMLPVGLSYIASIVLSYVHFLPNLWGIFLNHKGILNLITFFFQRLLFFILWWDWWCLLICECWLTHSYLSGIVPTYHDLITILLCCWIWFADILLEMFASLFVGDLGLWFSFQVVPLILVLWWRWPYPKSLAESILFDVL